ncbi:rhomboid family intramembrane serine protease [Chitinophaga silvatica]|uniref:Rhomboid family intramembrane serine protease n=1 Tax=Chitinophaga silvatica TaxID=2282649 RepID=A0A3E1YDV6_9BACT|nr:rhomboid family intramembrane serine protease [Chitinophaga silvatica]RFS24716.1 rhomboid family intramembrane serine protease [Chitinophaga silvatica]
MIYIGSLSLVIVLANFVISWKGLQDRSFFNRFSFEVERILKFKERIRLFSAGFLHVNWLHLFFNMLSLLLFSFYLDDGLTPLRYLALYFGSLLGGSLLSLFLHRNNPTYSSVGASGAICGVIFGTIVLNPGALVNLFGILNIPIWIYGLLYVLYAIYGIRSKEENIGHDSHIGGIILGVLIACVINPYVLMYHTGLIVLILGVTSFAIYVITTKPYIVLVDNLYYKQINLLSDIDHRYNFEKANKQKELDAILEKIHLKGINSLSKSEREKLERYSQEN